MTAVFPQLRQILSPCLRLATVAGEKSSIPQACLFEGNLSTSSASFQNNLITAGALLGQIQVWASFNYLDWDLTDFLGLR